MQQLIEKLKHRRKRPARPMPDLRPHALVAANLVLIAFFLFDAPVGAFATHTAYLLQPIGTRITDIGKSGWILYAAALLFFLALPALKRAPGWRRRFEAMLIGHMALYVFVSVAASGIVSNLIKRAIGRARPVLYEQWGTFGFDPFAGTARFESFPSGHATTIGALAMAMALILPRFRLAFLIAGLWLGFTRVIVAAHYPSDVIAGLSFGAWFSLVTAIAFARHRILFCQDGAGYPVRRRPI